MIVLVFRVNTIETDSSTRISGMVQKMRNIRTQIFLEVCTVFRLFMDNPLKSGLCVECISRFKSQTRFSEPIH